MLVALPSSEFKENCAEIYEKEVPVVWNFSSYFLGIPKLGLLLPDITKINYIDDREFDLQYYNYIMQNRQVFYEFFNSIVYPLYCGQDVYLLVDRHPFYDSITESLFKIIQERYGYNACYLINEYRDLDYMSSDAIFNVIGVYNLDQDKQAYTMMYGSLHLSEIMKSNTTGGE